MKISDKTLSVLKSFSAINTSIAVKGGSEIRTISPGKNIMAIAQVDETFETPYCIYDLPQFLSTISLIDSPDFDFGEKSVKIMNENYSVSYTYANEATVTAAPERNIEMPDVSVSFNLTSDVIKKTQSAASVLSVPHWIVKGEDGELNVEVGDSANKSGNKFKHKIGEAKNDFEIVFEVDNLKLMPGDYDVEISTKGISHFSNNDGTLQYYIATKSRG